ncbi:MAG TPA: amidohydrolase family protein [Ignavibacteriales bacterium]|nr:amidohydrolase family protein [Ignavibacteriales bacterium]
MLELLYSPSVIVTAAANGKNFKRGGEMREVQALEGHSVVIEDEIIKDIIPDARAKKGKYDKIIDLKGKTVLPGLVDCHTHLVFAGSRADEFRQKISGATYEEIASKGGGDKKNGRGRKKNQS